MLAGIEILPQLLTGDRNIDPPPATRADKRVTGYLFLGEPLRNASRTDANHRRKGALGDHVMIRHSLKVRCQS
jgi:hypothetical protein